VQSSDSSPISTADLKRLSVRELHAMADELRLPSHGALGKPELILRIEQNLLDSDVELQAVGVLDVTAEGFGFIRSQAWSYLPSPDDVYVAPSQIKRYELRTGDTLQGQVRPPKEWEKFLSLARLDLLNGDPPVHGVARANFETLPPRYPDERLRLERPGELSARVVDLVAPIGKGQRGLIVAPPRAGKTILMQQMANAIAANHPEVTLIVLLIDERPEEVTDFQANVPRAEVVSSTFDESAERHVHVADMVIEKAKRLVEHGRHVVILLDSITRLARAHNTVAPHSGKILSGGVEANALHKPKKFFGTARNIAGGGSLTIIATALVETGSRMDDVIFEEFKGTGNMELVLDRKIADRRIFPAIDLARSGTRREELLLDRDEANRVFLLRTFLADLPSEEAIAFLLQRMQRTRTNREFFATMAEP
jgi:transcription termination factor Rho